MAAQMAFLIPYKPCPPQVALIPLSMWLLLLFPPWHLLFVSSPKFPHLKSSTTV